MRRALPSALALALAVGVPAAPALAQDGVHLDPNSPAGKEYAIPLEKARREALGQGAARTTKPGTPATAGSSLFGEGVTRPARARGRSRGSRHGRDARGGTPQGLTAADRLKAAAVGADRGSPTLAIGGIALAALVAAGGLGLLLRRGLRS